ncbi:MAG: hypothetical protein RLZ28_865 [Actinomycetota bacterium]|jgi:hypothetical protein
MKKIALLASVLVLLVPTNGAHASVKVADKLFSNCAALNKVYPGGVAKSKSVKNKGGLTKNRPKVSSKIYLENQTKDRDKDGIACEK